MLERVRFSAVPGPADLPLRLARRVVGMTALNHLVRIEPVLALVDELGGGTLLDAGSGSIGLSPWLGDEWSVTAVDTSFEDYGAARGFTGIGRAVTADVRDLPFTDRSFDAVVALDLLEHVPAADRLQALAELRRVTRRRLVVGCPTGETALEADRGLSERLRHPPEWLAEHLALGFPRRDQLAAELGPHGRLRLLDNEAVRSHVRLVRAELTIPGFLAGRLAAIPLARALRNRGRARALAGRALRRVRGADRPPAYRTIAVLDVR
jgi:methyltransferase family protein